MVYVQIKALLCTTNSSVITHISAASNFIVKSVACWRFFSDSTRSEGKISSLQWFLFNCKSTIS